MKVLSVICARAGSKGLKNKCIIKIKNRMVIEYSIEYSMSLGKNVKTVVSTDIDRVIEYCEINDIEYIRRDPKLCEDETKIDDVLADAIGQKGEGYNYCSLVYGNLPTRYPRLFHGAVKFLKKNIAYDAVISMQFVKKFHPEWMCDYNKDVMPKLNTVLYRRQSLPPKIIHDGHTLLFKSNGFMRRHKNLVSNGRSSMYAIFGNKIKPMVNDEIIVDIDSENDMKVAKAIISQYGRQMLI